MKLRDRVNAHNKAIQDLRERQERAKSEFLHYMRSAKHFKETMADFDETVMLKLAFEHYCEAERLLHELTQLVHFSKFKTGKNDKEDYI